MFLNQLPGASFWGIFLTTIPVFWVVQLSRSISFNPAFRVYFWLPYQLSGSTSFQGQFRSNQLSGHFRSNQLSGHILATILLSGCSCFLGTVSVKPSFLSQLSGHASFLEEIMHGFLAALGPRRCIERIRNMGSMKIQERPQKDDITRKDYKSSPES